MESLPARIPMENLGELIAENYLNFVGETGKKPASVRAFAKEFAFEEKEFYDHYASFSNLEKKIWAGFHKSTLRKITGESVWEEYTVREKILAYFFTLLEELKKHRTWVGISLEPFGFWNPSYSVLDLFKTAYEEFAAGLIAEGLSSGEFSDRMFLSERYRNILGLLPVYLINFWMEDQSEAFEKTDAAVEKTVNLAADILGENVFDSAFDFLRFLLGK